MGATGIAWLFAKRVLTGTVVGLAIADEFASVAGMHGHSMQPTLNPAGESLLGFLSGDFLLLDKISGHNYHFSRGDIVVFRSPLEPREWMVKRLIALQGDWVTVPGRRDIVHIPRGHCWVEGDNVNVSLDSKSFGPIPLALLKAKATHVIWPPNRMSHLESKLPEGRVLLEKV
ncbi:hypothetical protein O6H91_12G062800 [Diphasiastrum complanatum]|uniref:Uncharacterized protein n=1 Tax=Diphasiastrum complanatum TaxID=34168 RepID=A0ACC2C322_DIPCM|nr:hypothetical protein O6H91_12G062800 [Diphasiastrum complanatum]